MIRMFRHAIVAALIAVPFFASVAPARAASLCPSWTPKQWLCGGSASNGTVPAGSVPGDQPAQPSPIDRLVFGDDFDATGDLSQWDGRRELAPETTDAYSGKFAVRATSTGSPATALTNLHATYDEIYYRVRFKIVSQGRNSVYLMRVRTADNDAITGFYVSNSGALGFRNDITGSSFTSTTLVPRGEWNELQIRVKIDGRQSQVAAWLNGESIASLSQTLWLGTSPIGRIELGDVSGGREYDVIYDDVAVDTAFIPSDRLPDPISGMLTIQTSPAIAGVPFILDGTKTFYTDESGMVQIQVNRWSTDLRTRITVPETDIGNDTKVRLARWFRWSDSVDGLKIAGLDVYVPITWTFVNLEGQPVDPSLVTSIRFKSSTGVFEEFDAKLTGTPQYLHMSREIATPDGPETKDLYYTVDQVIVDGSNVVIKSSSKFFPRDQRQITIPLMFYSARFTVGDAFFGFPIGKHVKLVAPDGEVSLLPIGDDGVVFVPALARGEYQVSVEGPGMSPPRPVAVSRNQDVELKVFSYLDMAVCVLVMVAFAFGLLFVGRPKLLSPRYVLGWAWNEVRKQSRGVLAR